jgi:primosomal protein N' (replication factor Y) (superfamily II helicase)
LEQLFSKKINLYSEIVKENINNNAQTLIIVPELLSAQPFFEKFNEMFKGKTILYDHKLTENGRIMQYYKTKYNQAQIIIGTKLSLFLAFKNLKTIIVENEHEWSYKNEMHPRFDARNIALKLKEETGAGLIFSSPVPRIETYYNGLQKKYLSIKAEQIKPKIQIIDLKNEIKRKNFGIFSETLISKIKNCLENKNQVILSLNKLGSGNLIFCKDCNYEEKCDNCDTHLKFNSIKKILYCPHCSFKKEIPEKCPKCKSALIKIKGIGTQKVEEEAKKLFPSAKIFRADHETLTAKNSEKNLYENMKNKQIDILIGTQIVNKPLNLPNIKLFCSMLADVGLNFPDFRCEERGFQIISSTINAIDDGEIIIQTYNPENPTIKSALEGNFHDFAKNELKIREKLNLPPFSKQIKIIIEEKTAEKAEAESEKLTKEITEGLSINNQTKRDFQISNFPALSSRLNNKYFWQTLLTIKKSLPTPEILKNLPENSKIEMDPI